MLLVRSSPVMFRSIFLRTSHVLSFTRGHCLQRSPMHRLLCGTQPQHAHKTPTAPIQRSSYGPLLRQATALANYSDLSSDQKYTLIYSLPHIMTLRAVSRLKLIQTGITMLILPPVFYFYLQGNVSYFLLSYTTGIALFAGAMLYTVSHLLRRVVGMMYLDSSQTTLKVGHLTFWGRRHDIYLPVTDVMPIADSGDKVGESIQKLKRYSTSRTMYFSTRFGRVVDKQSFERVFGTLK